MSQKSKLTKTGPDSLKSWFAVLCAGTVQVPVIFSLKVMGVVFVALLREFNLSRESASWPLSIFVVSSQITSPILPILQKYVKTEVLLTLSCLLSASALILLYFVRNILHVTLLFSLHGAAIGAIYVFSTFLLIQNFKEKRTAATGLASAVTAFATLPAPSIMELLINTFKVRQALVLIGFCGLLTAPFIWSLRTPKWLIKEKADSERERLKESKPRKTAIFAILKSKRFILDATSVTVIYNSMNLYLLLAIDFALDKGVTQESAILVIPAYCLGDLLMRIVIGFVIDSKFLSCQACLAILFIAEGLSMSLFSFVPISWMSASHQAHTLLAIAVLVGGCCGGKVSLIPMMLVNDFTLENFTSTLGTSLLFSGIFTFFRPWIVGYFRDINGDYRFIFFGVVISLIICGMYWTGRERQRLRKLRSSLNCEQALS